jgi:hypothetical protein
MVHIKLFENFQGSMEKVYATCFQGDACVGIGILDEDQQRVLQDALDRLISEHPDFTEVRIEKVDVTGMGYVLHDENGEFTALPGVTNPLDYGYYIKGDGTLEEGNDDDNSRIFDLVKGRMLSIDHHSNTELLTVPKFIINYIGNFI